MINFTALPVLPTIHLVGFKEINAIKVGVLKELF